MKKQLFLAILVCVVLVLGSAVVLAQEPKYGGTLVFGSGGDATRLDPADVTDGLSITRTDNIFEGLVQNKPGTTEIEPCLAESREVSEDGLAFTFHLRKGVKF
ncbi:MAG TPA: ABC transporter substrate-binding protein, partial [Candidatus Atribacteria bacterium]|nr:ABC transporter substrate-binding protein [Candidatus Atribacteria bacterium]